MLFIDIHSANMLEHRSEGEIQAATERVITLAIRPMVEAIVDQHLTAVLDFEADPVKAREIARRWARYSLIEWLALEAGVEVAIVDEPPALVND